MEKRFNNRDISWLYFNDRVLQQAARIEVPLLERFKFLSIFSSNLDEFYRVRMPAVQALQQIEHEGEETLPEAINGIIKQQQQFFGRLLKETLLPALLAEQLHLIYNEPLPAAVHAGSKEYMLNEATAFLHLVWLSEQADFFPESNNIYIAFPCMRKDVQDILIVNIPAEDCGRFYAETVNGVQYVVFLDDLIKEHLKLLLPEVSIMPGYSFKMTRDADLDLQDEFEGDIAEKIEKKIAVRDFGLATRFLYDANMPSDLLDKLSDAFKLQHATLVEGGAYHNLKDLGALPFNNAKLRDVSWKAIPVKTSAENILDALTQEDILLSVPYHGYRKVLQFFNQAAIDPEVTEIAITLYRIAGNSLIANALISAAKNGKQVTVFVELKARFDEANNIRWAKKMKAAGVKIIYSIPGLKVHAKVALVKRRVEGRIKYYGVFSTGNFNESTARFYTDHVLMTCHKEMLREAELLFLFLAKRRIPTALDTLPLNHLLIAQFNLQQQFIDLIEAEINFSKQGLPAAIIIKLNNLEEEVLINKLYEASAAGVKIKMLVRSICRIRPGVAGLSENIEVHRIVDRYLEHPRIFMFYNNGEPKVFLGSADWMNRNIYRRIEVCFPVYDNQWKTLLIELLDMQWKDRGSAVGIDFAGKNVELENVEDALNSSQEEIYKLFKKRSNE